VSHQSGQQSGAQGAPQRNWKQSIRPALTLSLIFGIVAGGVTAVSSVGGVHNGLNLRLAGTAFLIAFVAGLLVISLLMMVVKENPAELGRGSGVHRSSELDDAELDRLERGESPMPDAAGPAPVADGTPGAERAPRQEPGAHPDEER